MEFLGLQTDIAWHDPAANIRAISALLDRARPAVGALVVLPEMCASGFSRDVAAATAGAADTEAGLAQLAKKYGIALMAGLAVMDGGCGANEAVTFGPDGTVLARYRKLQPFSMAGEGENYPAGDRVVTFEWGGLTIAPFICYDLRFPEIFRAAVAKGAEVFALGANWPNRRQHHWTTLLKARAIENQAAVIGVNRAGTDPEFIYDGGSLILGPQGEVLADAGEDSGFIRAQITPELIREWRGAFPALRDRRSDYSRL
jgi:omega-amidase